MRTTIDIPDDLFRQVKARAAMRGMKLKEYVAVALQESLFERQPGSEIREVETEYAKDALVLGDGCVLPLISGKAGEEMASISENKIDEILEEDDVANALLSGGR